MKFIVATLLTNLEINQIFEGHFVSDYKIPAIIFSPEKNKYEYHGYDPKLVDYCKEDNLSWKAWFAGWNNCISNISIELPPKESIDKPEAYLFMLKECSNAISSKGILVVDGYASVYKFFDNFLPFIKEEFEKEYPLPEFMKYVPEWNDYKAKTRNDYEKYEIEASNYCDCWNSWKKAWEKAIKSFQIKLPNTMELNSETTCFQILEQTEKSLLNAGFKPV